MTITVCVLTPEGMVLATDSRQVTSSPPSGHLRVSSDCAQKVFQLSPHLAASICGQGFFYANRSESPRSIGLLLRAAAAHLPERATVSQAAAVLHARITDDLGRHQHVTTSGQEGLAIHVAGYSPGSVSGELYRCTVPGEASLERTTSDAGLVWNGQGEIVERLFYGLDPRLLQLLTASEADPALTEVLREKRAKLQLHIGFQTMPLQEAVNLAVLLVHTTIELQRLSDGIVGAPGQFPTCGGAIEVAALTPGKGFHWIQHRTLEAKPCGGERRWL